jgi:hypothetical protein
VLPRLADLVPAMYRHDTHLCSRLRLRRVDDVNQTNQLPRHRLGAEYGHTVALPIHTQRHTLFGGAHKQVVGSLGFPAGQLLQAWAEKVAEHRFNLVHPAIEQQYKMFIRTHLGGWPGGGYIFGDREPQFGELPRNRGVDPRSRHNEQLTGRRVRCHTNALLVGIHRS